MPKQSFRNTAQFGALIRHLREEVLHVTIEAIEKSRGPSASTQSRIENGADVPVSDATIGKYITAFGPEAQMLRAVAVAHKHINDTGRKERQRKISREAARRDRGALYLGQFLDTGEPVVAGALVYPSKVVSLSPHLAAHNVVGEVAIVGHLARHKQFQKAVIALAARQPALVLVGDQERKRGWPDGLGELHAGKEVFGFGDVSGGLPSVAIDPLAGVFTLADAKRRTAPLGVRSEHSRLAAWVVLLSNVLAVIEDMAPILAFSLLKRSPEKWRIALDSLQQSELEAGIPEWGRAIAAAESYLMPWVDEYVDANWNVEVGVKKGTVTWNVTHTDASVGVNPWTRDKELWVYDDKAYESFPAVVYRRGVPNVVIEQDRIAQSPFKGQTYYWCPIGSDDSVALVREQAEGGQWRPAQMF
ncbi:Uncharacterised protein [Mycobacteroides abscessus subsp. massiliense]|uniref:helix-turn-helix domain-containing protein n=1 Tax=Mycobacteroides abscessus TaxID=36809 RepID=UPI0009A87612|nr:helix-turn-helix domain-containing protein [Mycobacteroides abscessus]MBE5502453.1 hypothetical protein [Mycobacteroides abscessus]SLH58334.1 Uncharacterised protein [Mycobacteroides abscessus subsp. massiliense]